jgi:transketolase
MRSKHQILTMRDALLECIYAEMRDNSNIYFLTADFGAPILDKIRNDYKNRFINVGVAEQNLINISSGLASEGYDVYAFAIAPFITMRCYEQIRINLALTAGLKKINVNLIGVGAGVSYDVSGPTHHCLEDLSIMSLLPNFTIFSPSDVILVKKFFNQTLKSKNPKYLRFDSKALGIIDEKFFNFNFLDGFRLIKNESEKCMVTTGYMTHVARRVNNRIKKKVDIIDFYNLKKFNENKLISFLKKYKKIITLEESFEKYGAIENIIKTKMINNKKDIKYSFMGFKNEYTFEVGDRNFIHKLNKISETDIISELES